MKQEQQVTSPQQALAVLTSVVEQVQMLPAQYRQVAQSLELLGKVVDDSRDKKSS